MCVYKYEERKMKGKGWICWGFVVEMDDRKITQGFGSIALGSGCLQLDAALE